MVFESKKVSVLVADPLKTKVNVKADVDDKTINSSDDRSTGTTNLPPMQLPPVPVN